MLIASLSYEVSSSMHEGAHYESLECSVITTISCNNWKTGERILCCILFQIQVVVYSAQLGFLLLKRSRHFLR